MISKNPTLGVILAFFAALLFGLNASTSKVVMASGISPDSIVLFRSAAAALIAGLVVLIQNRKDFALKLRELPFLIGFGIFGIALMQWAYSNAVSRLPVGIALLFEYTAIIITPIAALLLFKQRTSSKLWIGVALVIGGLVIVGQIWNGGLDAVGVAFAFAAAFLLSAYFIMGERAALNRSPMSTMFYTMSVSTIFWLIFSPWWNFDPTKFSEPINLTANLAAITVPGWFAFVWLGVMGSFMPMMLSFTALKHVSATVVSVVSTAEPVFAFLFGLLWLSENISGLQMLGGLLVLLGILIAQTAKATPLAERKT